MGVIYSYQTDRSPSKVIEGSLLFMILLSLLDATGPQMSKIASAFALLALLSVTIAELPQILSKINPEREGRPNRPTDLGF